ncbi:hypothetical protein ACTQ4E_08270 [Lawsonibacter sp. LCP25S3_G6]
MRCGKAAAQIDRGTAQTDVQEDTAMPRPECTVTTFQAKKRRS